MASKEVTCPGMQPARATWANGYLERGLRWLEMEFDRPLGQWRQDKRTHMHTHSTTRVHAYTCTHTTNLPRFHCLASDVSFPLIPRSMADAGEAILCFSHHLFPAQARITSHHTRHSQSAIRTHANSTRAINRRRTNTRPNRTLAALNPRASLPCALSTPPHAHMPCSPFDRTFLSHRKPAHTSTPPPLSLHVKESPRWQDGACYRGPAASGCPARAPKNRPRVRARVCLPGPRRDPVRRVRASFVEVLERVCASSSSWRGRRGRRG